MAPNWDFVHRLLNQDSSNNSYSNERENTQPSSMGSMSQWTDRAFQDRVPIESTELLIDWEPPREKIAIRKAESADLGGDLSEKKERSFRPARRGVSLQKSPSMHHELWRVVLSWDRRWRWRWRWRWRRHNSLWRVDLIIVVRSGSHRWWPDKKGRITWFGHVKTR